jgi:hypothetical protein
VEFWQRQFEAIITRQLDKWILIGLICLFIHVDYKDWAYFALGALAGIITGRSGQRRSGDDPLQEGK